MRSTCGKLQAEGFVHPGQPASRLLLSICELCHSTHVIAHMCKAQGVRQAWLGILLSSSPATDPGQVTPALSLHFPI